MIQYIIFADLERVDIHQVVLSDRTLDASLIQLLLLVQDPVVFSSRDSLGIYLWLRVLTNVLPNSNVVRWRQRLCSHRVSTRISMLIGRQH
jgi:hypothetical protein